MILTRAEILRHYEAGSIVIDPFDPARLEPNSYGFSLGNEIVWYEDDVVDARTPPTEARVTISSAGFQFLPGRAYLGCTMEKMGSYRHAATLYANRSVSTLGVWIQMSAPLGHTGAIIPWTLEITVSHPVWLFAGQPIGKIAFWENLGAHSHYSGRYVGSTSTVASRFALLGNDEVRNDCHGARDNQGTEVGSDSHHSVFGVGREPE